MSSAEIVLGQNNGEKMVCIHNSDDENAIISMGTMLQTLGWK